MSTWDGSRTLVTGGGGFIGGHLAIALARAGSHVRAMCRYNSRGDRGTLDWFDRSETSEIEIVHGDLRDAESAQQAMKGIQIAFHLGAQIAIPYSYINPRDFFETNVGGTLNVAQAALAAGVERVVHVSTSEVYGDARSWPITAEHPLAPRSPYAASKAGADMLVKSFHASFGLPVVIARPFNTYGPHQSARAIIPTIAGQALESSTIKLGSLEPRRDFTFVSDTVAGLMSIAAAEGVIGETLQLGSGTEISVAALVETLAELVGHRLVVELDPQRVRPPESEVDRLLCDARTTTQLTGWLPTIDLTAGLVATLDWLRTRPTDPRIREYAT